MITLAAKQQEPNIFLWEESVYYYIIQNKTAYSVTSNIPKVSVASDSKGLFLTHIHIDAGWEDLGGYHPSCHSVIQASSKKWKNLQ